MAGNLRTVRPFTWPPPAAGRLSAVYLGESDIRDLDRLRKRQSRGLLPRSVLFCSILFHFWEAGRPGSVFWLCVLCLLLLGSFITMWGRLLLAQELESLTPPRSHRLLSGLSRFFKHFAEIRKRNKITASAAPLKKVSRKLISQHNHPGPIIYQN